MNSRRAKQNKALGDIGERLIEIRLNQLGIDMVAKLHNVWRIVRVIERARGQVLAWVTPHKVEGDYRGIIAGAGRSVLVEVKSRPDRLQYSALERHQRDALNQHAALGGLSLVGWFDPNSINGEGLYLMQWPIPGFKARTSLTPDKAARYDLQELADLRPDGAG